jgi:hypothetical protein
MTTAAHAPSATTNPTILRRAAVLIAPTGPLAVAVLRGILPYDTTDEPATVVGKIAENPAAQSAVVWLGYLALITLPLGVVVVGGAAMRARPVLGGIGAALAWVGFTSLAFIVASDVVTLAGVTAGLPNATIVTITTAVDGSATAVVAIAAFIAGHILGIVLLGAALWRVIPRWTAVALIISQPLHFVFAVIVPNHALDVLAWTLTGIGFAAAALRRPGSAEQVVVE